MAAFITSSISAVLGMAGGIILLGIMAIVIPEGYVVVALHGVVQLISNLTRSFVFRSHIRRDLISQFFPGAVFGLVIASAIIFGLIHFFNLNSAAELKVDFLKALIGVFILWFLFGKRHRVTTESPRFFGVGALSGLCTVFIGATGPLIAPFFLKGKLTKENIIANKAVCQAISHIGKMPLFILFFDFNYYSEIELLFPLTVAVFVGTNVGKRALGFIPEKIFRLMFKTALTLIALKLIADQWTPFYTFLINYLPL
ncbi:MAG: sulfite exporter TauE/SafE family protein [Candidatus Marinimicrobia bacterium]|nr:sulfite exporter TauE/SafE family protein [Candidatus Neomarinimicrobiota bacterium]MDP6852876.1 sulfite exporter TauE/SafE family protein [Candidatus Neomarinimicrobiota bacterium]